MNIHKLVKPALAGTVSLLILVACGNDSDNQPSGSTVTVGKITAFGSVWVNGVEYETTSSSFDVDDDSTSSQDDLSVGMIVTVSGSVDDDDHSHGDAFRIEYDEAIRGPVSSVSTGVDTKELNVLGTTVVVSATDTVFDDNDPAFSFDSIAENDVVEISGLYDGSGVLHATYIEKQGTYPSIPYVEIAGIVSSLTDTNFMIGNLVIEYDDSTEFDDFSGGALSEGILVEVKGVVTDLATPTVHANEVEDEAPELDGYNGDVSLEGYVSDFTSTANFRVNGQVVNANNAVFLPVSLAESISDGLRVEVEGHIADGIVVKEVKIDN